MSGTREWLYMYFTIPIRDILIEVAGIDEHAVHARHPRYCSPCRVVRVVVVVVFDDGS